MSTEPINADPALSPMVQRVVRMLTTSDDTERVRRFYEILPPEEEFACRSTTYMNLGLWEDGDVETDMDTAADRLATTLGAAAELGPDHRVLDVGFGYGDQDFHWVRDGLARSITGVNITPHHVEAAQRRAVEEGLTDRLDFREGSATELPFPDNSFDRVVALESAFHFFPRSAFFAEAARVLRPGGVLATADIVPFDAETPRAGFAAGPLAFIIFSVADANWYDAAGYATALTDAGLVDVEVTSIADRVWEGWRRHMCARIADETFRTTVGPEAHAAMAEHWADQDTLKAEITLLDYVITVARKPEAP